MSVTVQTIIDLSWIDWRVTVSSSESEMCVWVKQQDFNQDGVDGHWLEQTGTQWLHQYMIIYMFQTRLIENIHSMFRGDVDIKCWLKSEMWENLKHCWFCSTECFPTSHTHIMCSALDYTTLRFTPPGMQWGKGACSNNLQNKSVLIFEWE